MKMKTRLSAFVAATSLAAGIAVVGATAADAASFSFKCVNNGGAGGKDKYIMSYANGHRAGRAYWAGNPQYGAPGDAMTAGDSLSDGWYAEAHLSTGRHISTRGLKAPANTKWATGNLPEGHKYTLQLRMRRGTSIVYSPGCTVTA
ncbi:hypothetical protein F8568_045285 [Actinomadura sp. LD22]|uniref:Uncharacterized protein n=1 Tax=Actinomadura physcomitrii TaxID=2650748 RepID=A0A6I4MVU7_9ACTN|nr:hypothetical protein [Actinomadura physcomitrii]MWA07421.1 hypothetical protein [Actinomadura physcomitrii]